MNFKKGYYWITAYALFVLVIRSINFQPLGVISLEGLVWVVFDSIRCWAIATAVLFIVYNIIKLKEENK